MTDSELKPLTAIELVRESGAGTLFCVDSYGTHPVCCAHELDEQFDTLQSRLKAALELVDELGVYLRRRKIELDARYANCKDVTCKQYNCQKCIEVLREFGAVTLLVSKIAAFKNNNKGV